MWNLEKLHHAMPERRQQKALGQAHTIKEGRLILACLILKINSLHTNSIPTTDTHRTGLLPVRLQPTVAVGLELLDL